MHTINIVPSNPHPLSKQMMLHDHNLLH